jgi:hypothetical protein
MSVMNVARRAAWPAVAGLAACGLLVATAPAQAAPAALHVTGSVSLGAVTSKFTYQFSEAPNGTVYYAKGGVVYAVRGTKKPAAVLHAGKTVLAVAATNSDFFVQIGRLIIEFKDSNTHRVRSWTLPKSPAALTSAGLYSVGNTLWSWTDWATDQSGFEFANVNRIVTSSTAVHVVSKNVAYPADMSADKSGLYYEATIGSKDYLVRVSPSGHVTKRIDKNIDAPLAVAGGRVFLLAFHQPSGKQFLDAFRGSDLHGVFSKQKSTQVYDIAGTGAGLIMLQSGKISRLSTGTGAVTGTLSLAHLVTLVPGPSAAVITLNGGVAHLLRLAG